MCRFSTRFRRLALVLSLFSVLFCNCKSVSGNSTARETWTTPVEDVTILVSEEANAVQPEAEAAQTQYAQPQYTVYEDLQEITWQLCEIRIGYGRIEFDRQGMAETGMGDLYTLQLTSEGINGKAAPNRYLSTYELRHNHDFRLRPIVGTLMAANINIGGIMESEYYWYLQRATHWEIVNNGLELYAYPSQNEEIVMRYLRQ
jgi:hypothetical protein